MKNKTKQNNKNIQNKTKKPITNWLLKYFNAFYLISKNIFGKESKENELEHSWIFSFCVNTKINFHIQRFFALNSTSCFN